MFFRRLMKPVLGAFCLGVVCAVFSIGMPASRADTLGGGKLGIVLMHGKGGTQKLVALLGEALEAAGALVKAPLMPWSAGRIYDKSYEQSMAEIDGHVAALKAAGATRIVVAGHSLGGNAALGYGARRDGLAGIVLLAYGHVPGKRGMARKLSASVEKARQMIDAGNGAERAEFDDFGGSNATATGSANDVFSWFDPNGPATLAGNASALKPGTPVLCVDGKRDRWKRCKEILSLVPADPGHRWAVADADHRGTPAAAVDAVIAWLQDLKSP